MLGTYSALPTLRYLSSPAPLQVGGPTNGGDGVGYEGATVLEPKIGFYDRECVSLTPNSCQSICFCGLASSDIGYATDHVYGCQ